MPKEAMLASVCRDFAIKMNARRARGLMSSATESATYAYFGLIADDLPLSNPNSLGLSTAGQKNLKNRKPLTLL